MKLVKLVKLTLLGVLICLSVSSCNKDENNPNAVKVNGIIQKQGITTYQYGSHIIGGYAVYSDVLDLDKYVGKNVTVVGSLVKGYPLSGGPDYIEVKKIK